MCTLIHIYVATLNLFVCLVCGLQQKRTDEKAWVNCFFFVNILFASTKQAVHILKRTLLIGLNVYYRQDEVLNVMDRTHDIHPVWRQVFSRLLTGLVTKSEAPADHALTRDDLELLRCYRQDISDTVVSNTSL